MIGVIEMWESLVETEVNRFFFPVEFLGFFNTACLVKKRNTACPVNLKK